MMQFNEELLATAAPIRKPQYKLKFKWKRHRSLAIKANDKLLVCNGRLHWCDVNYDFYSLSRALQFMAADQWLRLPNRNRHLFQVRSQREVTKSSLGRSGYACFHWSACLRQQNDERNTGSDWTLQRDELIDVQQRLDFLNHESHRYRTGQTETNTSFVLDGVQSREFDQLFIRVKHVSPIWTSRMQNLARTVYWFGGADALLRFTTAMNQVPYSSLRYLAAMQRAIKWVIGLQKRLATEQKLTVSHDFDNNDLNDELHEWMAKRSLRFSVKGKIRSRLENAIANYKEAFTVVVKRQLTTLPSIIAAYAICAQNGTELYQRQINHAFEGAVQNEDCLKQQIATQVELSRRRCYPTVLRFLNQNWINYESRSEFRALARWVENGNQLDDIKYMHDNRIEARTALKIRPIRRAAERYQRIFRLESDKTFAAQHCFIYDMFPVKKADQVARWLELFPQEIFTQGVCDRIGKVFWLLIEMAKIRTHQAVLDEQLTRWSNRSSQIQDCFPDEASHPRQLRSWLRRLTYFQRLSGEAIRIPGSIKDFLEGPSREKKELDYLLKKEQQEELGHRQFSRLETLMNRSFDQQRFDRKATRLVMESCVLTAFDSLRRLLVGLAKQMWFDATASLAPEEWTDSRCIEIAQWVSRMEPSEKRLLKELFESYSQHGADAKSNLHFNREWIEQQRRAGFHVDQWLKPSVEKIDIGGKKFSIEISLDPYQTFLMGSIFNTCLAPDGCNEMAVLANAAHANKQVLYVRNGQHQIVARKLLSVSRKNTMLGYHCYLQPDSVDGEAQQKELQRHVAVYCGRLAARVGWTLTNEGTPVGLGHFWYDDGEIDWDDAARSSSQ